MDTNLRQSENKVTVEGILSEFELEEKKSDKGDDIIQGHVSLKVSDINTIRFGVYVGALKNNGDANPAYTGLKTVMNEFKSVADVGEQEADRISVNRGSFNFYHTDDGRDLINYKASFFHRIKEGEKYEPKSEFAIEVYISNIVQEFDKEGNETGRLLVKGWTVTFSGIEPITLIAPKEIASDIESMFEIGQTAKFYGDIVNERVEVVKEIPVAIGKPRTEVTVNYKNENVITGATTPYEEGISEFPPYPKDSIDLAIQERTNKLEENENARLNKANPFKAATPSGAAQGRTINW